MKRIIASIIISSSLLFGMFEFQGEEPVTLQLGYTAMALPDATEAMFYNPASLANPKTLGKAFAFTQYSTSHLGIMVYGIGLRYRTFGLSMIERGAKLTGDYTGRYAEGRYAISMGRRITDNLCAGLSLKIYKFSEPRYGASYSPSIDFGVIAKRAKWMFGFYWVNAAGSKLREESIPEYAQISLGFRASTLSKTYLMLEARAGEPIKVGFGEDINLVNDVLKLRGGIMHQGNLTHFATGFSAHYADLTLDYSVLFVPEMPISHSIGLSLRR